MRNACCAWRSGKSATPTWNGCAIRHGWISAGRSASRSRCPVQSRELLGVRHLAKANRVAGQAGVERPGPARAPVVRALGRRSSGRCWRRRAGTAQTRPAASTRPTSGCGSAWKHSATFRSCPTSPGTQGTADSATAACKPPVRPTAAARSRAGARVPGDRRARLFAPVGCRAPGHGLAGRSHAQSTHSPHRCSGCMAYRARIMPWKRRSPGRRRTGGGGPAATWSPAMRATTARRATAAAASWHRLRRRPSGAWCRVSARAGTHGSPNRRRAGWRPWTRFPGRRSTAW